MQIRKQKKRKAESQTNKLTGTKSETQKQIYRNITYEAHYEFFKEKLDCKIYIKNPVTFVTN